MRESFTRDLIEVLLSTLEQVERNQDLTADDPTLIELKRHIVRAIADLKAVREGCSLTAQNKWLSGILN